MKRVYQLILLFAIAVISITQLNAQDGYKGFISIGGGISTFDVGYESTGTFKPYKVKDVAFIDIETIHGYQFNSRYFLGVGAGAQGFKQADKLGHDQFITLNVPFAFRANILKQDLTPFIEVVGGPSIPIVGELKKYLNVGFLINPSIGIHFALSEGLGLNFSCGYKFHSFKKKETLPHYSSVHIISSHGNIKVHSWVARISIDF